MALVAEEPRRVSAYAAGLEQLSNGRKIRCGLLRAGQKGHWVPCGAVRVRGDVAGEVVEVR
jgi:hypothetical protein